MSSHRRLIVCFDGTNNDGLNTGSPQSNVGRLYSCIRGYDLARQVNQLKHYIHGLATTTMALDQREGGFGASKWEM